MTTDDGYREAAQQDHESAVAEYDLEQAYEQYTGSLGWYEWSAQQRAKWTWE
ncbi:hypothetical protein AB0F17_65745 [Nonomuraea sp. NPDC026600]|uniref:hypothetical protein n=1 Tax=Nonomuraea sp. NPDC026600 TaxID=3155363 RepID=UPI003405D0F3